MRCATADFYTKLLCILTNKRYKTYQRNVSFCVQIKSLVYIEGSHVIISKQCYISFSSKIDFVQANSAGPDEMPHYAALMKCGISSGSSVFAKVHV